MQIQDARAANLGREASAFDCKQAPFARHAFEVLASAFSEGQSGAGDQVFDCTRYENFARVGQGRHTGTDMNRYSVEIFLHDYAFASVQTRSHLDPERAHTVGDRARTTNRACGPVEDRKKAITGGADLAATVTCKFATDEGVMIVQQVPPAAVAQASGLLSGSDYVGEHYGGQHTVGFRPSSNTGQKLLDLVNNGVRVAAPWDVIGAG